MDGATVALRTSTTPDRDPRPTPPRRYISRPAKVLALVCGALAIVVGLVALRRPLFQGNHDVVDPGRVFRSAQPRGDWDRLIDNDHLASVLNLRGGSPSDSFYADEVDAVKRRDIAFFDFSMSAVRRPGRRELLALLDLFDRCRYPLLIHCKSGADRTGLASVLYLMSQRGLAPEQALRSFSIAYGHVSYGGPEHLHEPIEEYRVWLVRNGLSHTPSRFRAWVARDYRSDDPPDEFTPITPGPRVRHRREGVATQPSAPPISR